MKRLLYSQNLVVFRSVKNGFFSENSTRFSLTLFFVVPPQKRMPLQSGLKEKAFLFFKILSGISDCFADHSKNHFQKSRYFLARLSPQLRNLFRSLTSSSSA